MPDVDRLLGGNTTVGNWSLGQICHHLTKSVTWSVDGWIVRRTIGPLDLGRILKSGTFPGFVKSPSKYPPQPSVDNRAEAEALWAALWLFASHSGPLRAQPMAGTIPRDDWERFHYLRFAGNCTCCRGSVDAVSAAVADRARVRHERREFEHPQPPRRHAVDRVLACPRAVG